MVNVRRFISAIALTWLIAIGPLLVDNPSTEPNLEASFQLPPLASSVPPAHDPSLGYAAPAPCPTPKAAPLPAPAPRPSPTSTSAPAPIPSTAPGSQEDSLPPPAQPPSFAPSDENKIKIEIHLVISLNGNNYDGDVTITPMGHIKR